MTREPTTVTDSPGRGLPARTTLTLALAFTLAFTAYSVLWPEAPFTEGDSAQYLTVAKDLADGRLDRLHFRTPGYPLLLVLTGAAEAGTRQLFHASLLLHFVTIWILAVALRRSGGPDSLILILSAVLLLPPFVEPAAYLMTENLAQVGLAAGFGAMVLWAQTGRRRWVMVAGLAFSATTLVRPAYQALTPVICIALVIISRSGAIRRTADKPLAAGGATFILLSAWVGIVGGYAARNYVHFEFFGVAPSAGMHLSTRTTSFLERAPEEFQVVRDLLIRARDAELVKRGGTHTGTQAIWAAQAELEGTTGLTMPQLSALLVRMNLNLIRRAPKEYLQEVARSAATYWFPVGGPATSGQSRGLRWLGVAVYSAVVVVFFLQACVVVGIGVLALVLRHDVTYRRMLGARWRGGFAYCLALTIIFYTMVVSCMGDIGEPRQRRPTDVLVVCACLLAGHALKRANGDGQRPHSGQPLKVPT